MSKNYLTFLFIVVVVFIFWWKSLFVFFAQDDFVLINNFSQNNFFENTVNVFGPPKITHWRPVHNLYFMTSGILFGKNYFLYHFLNFLLLSSASFLVFRIVENLKGGRRAALFSALLFAIYPVHFVSVSWISGNATLIGLFFFLLSFYFLTLKKLIYSKIAFIFSLLASESFVVGFFVFAAYVFLWGKYKSLKKFLWTNFFIVFLFLLLKFLFFTPKETFDVYKLGLSKETFFAIKYYLLRVFGFGETSGDFWLSILLLIIWLIFFYFLLKKLTVKIKLKLFFMLIAIIGLFPFVLIPNNLSPHYMNLSVFGITCIVGIILSRLKLNLIFLLIFIGVFIYSYNLTFHNSWVIKRSGIAKAYIESIENGNIKNGSTIIFEDNEISTSKEAYFSLGTGKALNFWFTDKEYKSCFTFYEDCFKE